MKCPCCGKAANKSTWSNITWWCRPCDLEWDWTKDDGLMGYWSRSDLERLWSVGDCDPIEIEIPFGTFPVFGLGERVE